LNMTQGVRSRAPYPMVSEMLPGLYLTVTYVVNNKITQSAYIKKLSHSI